MREIDALRMAILSTAGTRVTLHLTRAKQILAALEAAREDVERYRWLACNAESLPYPDMWRDKEWLDAAIDQARGKGVADA